MTTRKTARVRDIRDAQSGKHPCRDTCFLFAVWGNGQVWPQQKSTLTDRNISSRGEPNLTKLAHEEGRTTTKETGTLVVVSPHKQARLRCGAGPVLLPRFDNGVPDVSHQQRASRIRDKVT